MRYLLLAISFYLLAGCTREAWRVPMVLPDSSGPPVVMVGKLKITGPVTVQAGGTGNVATTTDAAKAKAPVAAAPNAVASEARTTGGVSWWVWVGLVVVGAVAGIWLRGRC